MSCGCADAVPPPQFGGAPVKKAKASSKPKKSPPKKPKKTKAPKSKPRK